MSFDTFLVSKDSSRDFISMQDFFMKNSPFVIRPTRPPKPSRPSRPTKKPSQQQVKWPNFHLVDQQPTGSGSANDEKKDTTQHHFVSIKAPQDPRPTLTTRR